MRFARMPSSEPRPFRWRWVLFSFFLILLLLSGTALYITWFKDQPNETHIKRDFGGLQKPIFYQGELLKQSAIGEKESLKLPFEIIKSLIDPTLLYEAESNSIILTTQDKVVRLKTSQLTGVVNEKPFTLHFPVEMNKDIVYLPIEPLREYYNINLLESEENGVVFLHKEGDVTQWGKIKQDPKDMEKQYALRSDPSTEAPIYADLKQNAPIMIWEEVNGWYRAQLDNGIMGYVAKSEVILDHIEVAPKSKVKDSYVPWRPLGGKVNLTWQQVYSKNPDTSKLPPMPGLNVISPQWFHLMDGQGNLKNLADADFVQWAHGQGLQVWALFSNGFEQKQTTEALSTYDTRFNMIKQLVSFAQIYQIDGINIDFENVALKDKANIVQFVRELSPFLHEQGLVVSIDVTVKDGSDVYSKFMDRRAVKDSVDYMMVMTYDEHWSTSPIAGSVSSLPWVEEGIAQIIEEDEVPASKILMGIPFYTRIWTESGGKVTSKAVSMEVVQTLIKEKNLTPVFDAETGQNYVEYKDGNKTIRIWIEDAQSIGSRVELAKKLDLAGVASWSRSFESPDIWTVIQDGLEKRP
ncbi:glycosyl hydrolase [Paenibacillus psychroresistens]|uniref:Glycosyl hydrolase n=1 Tax=Paenibacillus psychroresistens TaxID=1778678 RepID=A0A6B8RDK4_9BACL|nr:glycosyl hydrolase family 18 protein [Paenibacillus psychroresistens]QGQ94511.1 glycosyl hydrolase [Paenibacillus psychroresistens]